MMKGEEGLFALFVGAADAEATHLTKPNASAGGRGY